MKLGSRLTLIHWNRAEGEDCAARLRKLHFEVELQTEFSPAKLKALAADVPDAIVIDLCRQPSHGREVAGAVRRQKATRLIPLVFVGGEPAKVENVKALLPDARYADWAQIGFVLQSALAEKPTEVVVPGAMAGYSGTPLPKKLGLKPGAAVVLIGAPEGFTLEDAPIQDRGQAAVVLTFVKSAAELKRRFPASRKAMLEGGRLWIAWPKKASGVVCDIGEPAIRAFGLAAGLVDFKICAIDETWSGLCFAVRK